MFARYTRQCELFLFGVRLGLKKIQPISSNPEGVSGLIDAGEFEHP